LLNSSILVLLFLLMTLMAAVAKEAFTPRAAD
jgi:hypothetical protein